MEKQDKVFRFTTRLVLAMLIVYILIIGKDFLTPLAWAIVIGLASTQFIEKMKSKSRLPAALIIIIYQLVIVGIIFSVFYFFYIELSQIIADLPQINDLISSSLHRLSLNLKGFGITIPDHIDSKFINEIVDKNSNSILAFISSFGAGIEHLVLGAVYLFFILFYGDLIPQFFESKLKSDEEKKKLKENTAKAISIIKSYIIGLMILALITGVLVYVILLILGVQYALFFAALLGVLSLIPFIGNPIGIVIVGLFTLVTDDALSTTLLSVGLIWLINIVHENLIRPVLMGDRLQINAFVVFISVIVGGLIWGISGMILFIPLAGIIKVALSYSESTSHYAILFSEKTKRKKAVKAKAE